MNTPVRRAWALSLLWIAVIVLESFAGSFENTGKVIYPMLHFLFPGMKLVTMVQVHAFLRKLGHFTGYCILSLTLYRSWWVTLASRAAPERLSWHDMLHAWRGYAVVLALLATLVVAGLDEFHQSLTPGRTGRVADVALDEAGGVLAQALIVIVGSAARPGRKRKSSPRPEPVTSS